MEKITNEKVERIVDLVKWFEEFQPNDLDQLERIMLGFRYVDNTVMENELIQRAYGHIKNTESEDYLIKSSALAEFFFRKDINERMKNK